MAEAKEPTKSTSGAASDESAGQRRSGELPTTENAAAGESSSAAAALFGSRLGLAERYAELLRTTGIDHGLIGPREADRIWDRHILNCAVVSTLLPPDVSVADVGSGAGLPGIVLAIARPDVSMTLVEPLERRVRWLTATIEALGIVNVRIIRARAEDVDERFDVVTARAVADLGKLVRWCLPLVTDSGRLLALKGGRAQEEIDRTLIESPQLTGRIELVTCGVGVVAEPAAVVMVAPDPARPHPAAGGRQHAQRGGRSPRR